MDRNLVVVAPRGYRQAATADGVQHARADVEGRGVASQTDSDIVLGYVPVRVELEDNDLAVLILEVEPLAVPDGSTGHIGNDQLIA